VGGGRFAGGLASGGTLQSGEELRKNKKEEEEEMEPLSTDWSLGNTKDASLKRKKPREKKKEALGGCQ